MQRAIRDTMTEHAGVVCDEGALLTGLAELDAIEARIADIGVHPDIAGYQDLAHAFDLKSALAARATLLPNGLAAMCTGGPALLRYAHEVLAKLASPRR
jgi:hypothetical protein